MAASGAALDENKEVGELLSRPPPSFSPSLPSGRNGTPTPAGNRSATPSDLPPFLLPGFPVSRKGSAGTEGTFLTDAPVSRVSSGRNVRAALEKKYEKEIRAIEVAEWERTKDETKTQQAVNAFLNRMQAEEQEAAYPNDPAYLGTVNEGYTLAKRNIPSAISSIYNELGPGKRQIRKVASHLVKRRGTATRENMTRRYTETINEAMIYRELQTKPGAEQFLLPFLGSEMAHGSIVLKFIYVEGMDLHDFIEGKMLTKKEKAALCIQAAQALEFMHRAGIAHRDVKAENFYVALNGGAPRVLIFDFGTSDHTAIGKQEDRTNFKGMVGKILGEKLLKDLSAESDTFLLEAIVQLASVQGGGRRLRGPKRATLRGRRASRRKTRGRK